MSLHQGSIDESEIRLLYNERGLVQDWGPPNDVADLRGEVPAWRLLKVYVEVREELVNRGRASVDEGWIMRDFFWVRVWSQVRSVHEELFGNDGFRYIRFRVETHVWSALEGWSMLEEL